MFLKFKKIFESLRLPLAKGSSTFLTKPLFPQGREDVTALRCSEPLRSKVGGPSKVFAMVVRDGTAWRKTKYLERSHRGKIEVTCLFIYVLIDDKPLYKVALNAKRIYLQEVQT